MRLLLEVEVDERDGMWLLGSKDPLGHKFELINVAAMHKCPHCKSYSVAPQEAFGCCCGYEGGK